MSKRLQAALLAESQTHPAFFPGVVDGVLGPKTQAAYRNWQAWAATLPHGIDVSVYQPVIDWGQCVAAGVSFAVMRASVSLKKDTLYTKHRAGAKAAGIPRGAYHFFTPWRSPKEQAALFAAEWLKEPLELPPVLDVESLAPKTNPPTPPVSSDELIAKAQICLTEIENLTKRTPLFYSYSAFVAEHKLSSYFSKRYLLWLADYREGPPTAPHDWPYTFHQYKGDSGRQVGVQGPCDLNRFRGTKEQLLALTR